MGEILNAREVFLKVLWGHFGRWYIWGGDDPAGFDCSGLVVEGLKSVGILREREDQTAADLWKRFREFRIRGPAPGALVFWGRTSDKVCHVEVCLDYHHTIGARGGGEFCVSELEARKANAFIKVRPIYGRDWGLELIGFVDVFTDH